ncbi:hypothetical protein IV203_019038 [Nitzschia inconspicua]|uniref:Uncharacterized protein n=1 Tax=Nitzschia inconspicua TaxID=303405 RepID=A0A9K3KJ25_9STRA|nr:hypothetical protein IV203_022638 [Nitzschia inconspicua]KAG7370468.1 hypothetical protein IV203_019038 [Nitzschia inconspicua]
MNHRISHHRHDSFSSTGNPDVSGFILREDRKLQQQSYYIEDDEGRSMAEPQHQLQSFEEQQYEHACKIWFQVPRGMAEREFRALSPNEREQVWADLTGHELLSKVQERLAQFDKSPSETQSLVRKLHKQLTNHLPNNQNQEGGGSDMDALAIALQNSPSYVVNVSTLTKFLTCQEWKVEAAYQMMKLHFQIKQTLFGNDLLGKDITLEDLDDRTLQCIECGAYQYSYYNRDRAGRAFSLLNLSNLKHHPQNFTSVEISRALFFQDMVLSNDESVHRLGVVRLCYFDSHQGYYHHHRGPDYELIRVCGKVLSGMPIRTVAFYIIITAEMDSPWLKASDVIVVLVNAFLRARTRIIQGSFMENMYTLMCLGIPTDRHFPVEIDGNPKTDKLYKWLKRRRVLERKQRSLQLGKCIEISRRHQ